MENAEEKAREMRQKGSQRDSKRERVQLITSAGSKTQGHMCKDGEKPLRAKGGPQLTVRKEMVTLVLQLQEKDWTLPTACMSLEVGCSQSLPTITGGQHPDFTLVRISAEKPANPDF